MPIANIDHFNNGPVVYILGHGVICRANPPKTIQLKRFNCISIVDSPQDATLDVESHINMLGRFLAWAGAFSNELVGPLARYWEKIMCGEDNFCIRFVSSSFEYDRADEYLVTTEQGFQYDLSTLENRQQLMRKADLTDATKAIIKKYQNDYMPIKEKEGITYGFELRERMLSATCNLFWQNRSYVDFILGTTKMQPKIDGILPPMDTGAYVQLDCKIDFPPKVGFSLFFNKEALRFDIEQLAVSQSANFVKYVNFNYCCKQGGLSGSHFIFIQMKCLEDPCPAPALHAHDPAISVSNLLNSLITGMHIFIKKPNQFAGSREEVVHLFHENKLGEQHIDDTNEFKYYDLTMPEDSTLVLGTCSGHDTVLEEIFS